MHACDRGESARSMALRSAALRSDQMYSDTSHRANKWLYFHEIMVICVDKMKPMVEALDSPCTRTVSARVPRCIQSEAFWDYTANLTRICSKLRLQGFQCIVKHVVYLQPNRCAGARMVLPDLDRSCFAPCKALVECSMTMGSTGACCFFGLPLGLLI